MQIGKEGLTFESKSFTYFGAQALLNATLDPPTEYIPDYTVRPSADSIVIIITKRQYLAAIEATQFEEERAVTVSEASGSAVQKPDVFTKEWELAEDQDLQDSKSTGLSSITKFLSKKHGYSRKNRDQRRLLAESSEESEDSPPLHKALVSKHSGQELEDRFKWLSSSSDQNGESLTTHSDHNVSTELQVLPGVQDSVSDPSYRTSVGREEWAHNTSSEV